MTKENGNGSALGKLGALLTDTTSAIDSGDLNKMYSLRDPVGMAVAETAQAAAIANFQKRMAYATDQLLKGGIKSIEQLAVLTAGK